MKTCRTCQKTKAIQKFYRTTSECKVCYNARTVRYRVEKFGSISEAHRFRRYGVTLAELLKRQKGKCAVCGISNPARWEIDHDHQTGKVRGALCSRCNGGLHWIENSVWMEQARRYLSA